MGINHRLPSLTLSKSEELAFSHVDNSLDNLDTSGLARLLLLWHQKNKIT